MARSHLFLIIVLVVLVTPLTCESSIREQQDKWLKAGSIFESIAFPLRQPVISFIQQIIQNHDLRISRSCRTSLSQFARDLQDGEADAMHMLDAFAKFTPGVLKKRRLTDFGHYDQCLSVENGRYLLIEYHWPAPATVDELDVLFEDEESTSSAKKPWIKDYSRKTRTCTMFMVPPMVGICVPRQCSQPDLRTILQSPLVVNQTQPFKVSFL